MGSQQALLAGASIGLAIAAPIGPMAIIVIRRTLAGGFLAGITTGAGASTVNLLYSILAVCGLDQIATHIQSNRKLIDVLIAAALAVFAVRILLQKTPRVEASSPIKRSLVGNYASAIAFNLFNPISFTLLLSAIAASTGATSSDACQPGFLAGGVFAGSIAWWLSLVGATNLIGARLTPAVMRVIDIGAGTMMFGLAIFTMLRLV